VDKATAGGVTLDRGATHPFDTIAPTYDEVYTDTLLGRWLRQAVWEHARTAFRPGDRVLELGCGTGADAVWLAQRGVQVLATDASPAMLQIAAQKATASGVGARVELRRLDLAALEPGVLRCDPPFDGALSNFGALNCLPDRRPLARALAAWVRPGGKILLVLMGPLCPWEIAWHLLHGQPRIAVRRLRSGRPARLGDGATVRVWYPSPRRLRAEFAPFFQHAHTFSIGALLPPTHLSHLVERWPRPFHRLAAWERRWSDRLPLTWLNDHYLAVLQRI
jgi:SAM-dependent methyltransferase